MNNDKWFALYLSACFYRDKQKEMLQNMVEAFMYYEENKKELEKEYLIFKNNKDEPK